MLNMFSNKFYNIFRYAAASSGVALMFPGTLLDRSFDPRSQAWYLNAMASPGKVVVSPPYLDPGGAGYIVTISHTVYQVGGCVCTLMQGTNTMLT